MPNAAEGTNDDRIRQFEAVTDASLAHLNVDELLVELLERVRRLLDVDMVCAHVLDAAARQLVPAAAIGIGETAWQGIRLPVGKGFAGGIVASREPAYLHDINPSTVLNPVLWESGIKAMLGVPMFSTGEVTGVVEVGTTEPREFTKDDANLLQVVADRIALTTQARLNRSDRVAASALQRSLLPPELPAIDGVQLAARYLVGTAGVGGDWYDVIELPSGNLGVVIGDVGGRGLRAAVVMGRLRSALRAYAIETEDPAEVITKLDRKAQYFEPDILATCQYVIVDRLHNEVRMSSAGHPPPVLARPGQPTRTIEMAGDLPVGVTLELPRTTITFDLAPGDLLCLYTDGLIERRGRSLDVGVERLCHAVTATTNPEAVCAEVLAKLVGSDPTTDDIALVAIGRESTAGAGPVDSLAERHPTELRAS